MKAPPQVKRKSRISEEQAGLGDIDDGRADSKTSVTVLVGWRQFAGADEEIRKAEIIDQVWPEDTGQTQHALVGPCPLARPLRRIGANAGSEQAARSESPAAIVRIAKKSGVCIRESGVEPDAELIAKRRAPRDAAELRKIRPNKSGIEHAPLLVALPVAKEEDAVAAQGATKRQTKLPSLEERIRIGGITIESRVSRQLVIPEEIERGTMKIVASGSGNHVDCAACSETRRQVEVQRRDLKLLDHLLGEPHGRAAIADGHDAASVDRYTRRAAI